MIDSRMFSMKRSVLAFVLLPAIIAAGREEPSSASRTATSTAEEITPAIASQPAADTVLISALLDLRAACGAGSCDGGIHGGTQNRICHTSHGTYATYLGKDKDDHTVIHLVRIHEGKATLLHTMPTAVSGSNSAHVLCSADGEIYVLNGGSVLVNRNEHASMGVHHLNRKTGTIDDYPASIPFNGGNNFGYIAAAIDTVRGRIYAVYSGGDAPGYFAWLAFDLTSMKWMPTATVAKLGYRHCYNYCFAGGRGGMVILSERDITTAAAGLAQAFADNKVQAKYVWDELRLFYINDLASPEYTAVDVEKAVYDIQARLYPTVQNNYQGDAYIDASGNLHVLYASSNNNGKAGTFLRHAVFNARQTCIYNDLLEFQGGYMMRMAQSTGGVHYIIAMPYKEAARVQIWRATDTAGLHYRLFKEHQFPTGAAPTYAGLAVSCPRGGSPQNNVIDCLFPVNHDYFCFRIVLPDR